MKKLLFALMLLGVASASAQNIVNVPGVSNTSPPSGFQAQNFRFDCSNATPTAGTCLPLVELAIGGTINSSGNPAFVQVTNTLAGVAPGDAVTTTVYGGGSTGGASPVVGAPFLFNGTTYDRMREGVGTGVVAMSLPTGTPSIATGNAVVLTQGGAVLAANNGIFTGVIANAVGGATQTGNIAANNTTAVVIKASGATLYSLQLYGIGAAPAYLKIYNATSATCGSGTPVGRYMIPAASTAANGAGSNIDFGPTGVAYGTGITYCVTTGITDADTTAPAASTFLVNIVFK